MFRFFVEGGLSWMSLMTLELIALFLAAWKAPAWVKEIGLIAMVTGFLGPLVGFYRAAIAVVAVREGLSPVLLWAGIQFATINIIYGCIVYGVSLILRIVQKPRLM